MIKLCLVFKRNVNLSGEISENSINFKNKFSNMRFSSFYRSPLTLKEYFGETGSFIKHDEILNIEENSNIPLKGLISFNNFKNTKQFDILETEFNKENENECKNISFFNEINNSYSSRIQELNNNIDVIKYKIIGETEIISDNINSGAIDINFEDNIFSNLIIIDIYTERFITGCHGAAVSGSNASGFNGGDGSDGNDGKSAIIFKGNKPNNLKGYIYEDGNKISSGFSSSGGNGGNAGKPREYTPAVVKAIGRDPIQAKWRNQLVISSLDLSDGGWVHTGYWHMSDGAGNWYYAVLIKGRYTDNDTPVDASYLGHPNKLNINSVTEPLKNLKAEFTVRDNERNGWNIMQVDTKGVNHQIKKINFDGWGYINDQNTSWPTSGSREGYVYPATINYYQYRNDNITPGNSFNGTIKKLQNYSPAVTHVEGVKGHDQPLQKATNASINDAATPRTHNASKAFTPTKGSYGNNASVNLGDNLLINEGTRGEGGDPGTNDSKINNLIGEEDIFYELIRI